MDQFEKINHWVDQNQDDVIAFLQTILRIPSETGNEAPIQDFMENYAEKLGAQTDRFVPSLEELRSHPAFVESALPYENRPNVVATFHGTGGGRSLLFNGHIDVIPEGSAENWKHGAWSGDLEDGKIYGRGASDMKSGAAAMTMAVRTLKECGIHTKGDVILEYVMDEELTGNGTLACVMKGYHADAGICCETSSMCVQPASIGRIWFEIRIKGKGAGIQKRYEGINAIDLGYIVTKAVSEFETMRLKKVSHPLYPDILSSIPCMVGQFESGSYASAFPDSCVLKGSMATVPGEDSNEVKAEFIRFIKERAAAQSEWLAANPPEILFTGYFAEPSEIPADTPIVSVLRNEFSRIMKKEAVISGRQGAADIRHLNRYGNTPTVIFGPGLTEQMHANNEWVYAKDYLDAVKILACTIVKWCGTEEEEQQ